MPFLLLFFFFKQKTAYEMRISDWSSDGALPISTGDGRWQLGGLPPIELKSAKLSIDDNGAAGTDIELKLPFASGVISGTANLAAGANFMDRSLRGELKIDMPDLAWLRLVTTEVSSAEGHASGCFQLDGTLADPKFEIGRAHV